MARLHQAEASRSSSEAPRHADHVARAGATALDDPAAGRIAEECHRDDELVTARDVPSDHRHPKGVAALPHAGIESLQEVHLDPRAHPQGHQSPPGCASHGGDVAAVHGHRLVAEVRRRGPGKVEVHAFDEQVGREEDRPAGGPEDGGVVTDPGLALGGLAEEVTQALDQPELPHLRELHAVRVPGFYPAP